MVGVVLTLLASATCLKRGGSVRCAFTSGCVVCGMCGAPLRAYGLELDRQWASQAGWLHGDPAHPVLDASVRLRSVRWSCSVWCVSCMLCASSRWMPYSTRECVLCLCVHGTAGWVGDYVNAVGGLKWYIKWYTSLVSGAYEWGSRLCSLSCCI